jgi:hypothetical protein
LLQLKVPHRSSHPEIVVEDEAVDEGWPVEVWVGAVADVPRAWETKLQKAGSCFVATVRCLPKHQEAFEVESWISEDNLQATIPILRLPRGTNWVSFNFSPFSLFALLSCLPASDEQILIELNGE